MSRINKQTMMKFLKHLTALALAAVALVSCAKDEQPNPQMEPAQQHTERISLSLSGDLQQGRSLTLDEQGASLPLIDPDATDFTTDLFFKKIGTSGLGHARVTFTKETINGKTKLKYSGEADFTSNFAAGVNPRDGGDWYVAGIIGGGELNSETLKQSVSFSGLANDPDGSKNVVNMPLMSKWTRMYQDFQDNDNNGNSRYTNLHFLPQGVMLRVNLTTEAEFKGGLTWGSVVTNVLDNRGQFDFGALTDAQVQAGQMPQWTFSESAPTIPALLPFKLKDAAAGELHTYYVWGMARTGVTSPQTTVEAGFLNFVQRGSTETFASNAQMTNGMSYPINVTLSEAGMYSVLRPLYQGAYLNQAKTGVVSGDQLAANPDAIGYFNPDGSEFTPTGLASKNLTGYPDVRFAVGSDRYHFPNEFEWSAIFSGFNDGLGVYGGYRTDWERYENMPAQVGSAETGIERKTYYHQFRYQNRNGYKNYSLKFQAFKEGISFRWENNYGQFEGTNDLYRNSEWVRNQFPKATHDAQRVAMRYTTTPLTNGAGGEALKMVIDVVPLGIDDPREGKAKIDIATIYDQDAWFDAQPNKKSVTLYFAKVSGSGVSSSTNPNARMLFSFLISDATLGIRTANSSRDFDRAGVLVNFTGGNLENSNTPTQEQNRREEVKYGVFLFNSHH